MLYMMPINGMEEWMKVDPEIRKVEEDKLNAEWTAWAEANKGAILDTAGAGKTKRVTAGGVEDTKNDVMMYSLIEAESYETAAAMFENHPHLKIPEAWIDIMASSSLPGMGG